jgi:uncharacterized protein YndB with AHSA1/START domain
MNSQEQSFKATLELAKPPSEVFAHLTRDVSQWWGGKDLQGTSVRLGDEFTIRHGDVHFSRQRVVELVPNQRLVWRVTESRLSWLQKDQAEWTDTQMVFELSPHGSGTRLRFTHEGLVPAKECYPDCSQGWGMVIKDYLFRFVTEGKVAERLFR